MLTQDSAVEIKLVPQGTDGAGNIPGLEDRLSQYTQPLLSAVQQACGKVSP